MSSLLAFAFVALSALAASSAAAAEAESPAEPVTLEAAMAWARHHAPAAGSAEAQSIIARARVDVARASYWPTVSGALAVGAGAANNHGLLGDQVCADPSLGVCTRSRAFADADAGASIDVRVTVFDFGRRDAANRAADSTAEAAALQAQAIGDEIAAAAAVAFSSASANLELQRTRMDIVERRTKSLAFAQERVRLGVAPPIEATRARVSFETARLDTATADAAVDDAHAALRRALGLSVSSARGPLALAPVGALVVVDDPQRAADIAERERRELRMQKKRVAAADADSESARAQLWPALSASAAASARASGYSSQSPSATEGASVGLLLNVPIFEAGLGANVRAAEAAAGSQRALERERVFAVRADAAQAAVAVRAQRHTLASVQVLVDNAETNLAQAEGRYHAGAGSLLELVDAQTEQSNAQLALAQARFQLATAQVRLLAAMGTLGAG